MPVLSSYVGDHAALPRMSANADFSTLLKCLASGKKSIEQLRPSAPRQTSALELLVVHCFRILRVYPCALYYGMLILSHALGACPTPPGSYQHFQVRNCYFKVQSTCVYFRVTSGMCSLSTQNTHSYSPTTPCTHILQLITIHVVADGACCIAYTIS